MYRIIQRKDRSMNSRASCLFVVFVLSVLTMSAVPTYGAVTYLVVSYWKESSTSTLDVNVCPASKPSLQITVQEDLLSNGTFFDNNSSCARGWALWNLDSYVPDFATAYVRGSCASPVPWAVVYAIGQKTSSCRNNSIDQRLYAPIGTGYGNGSVGIGSPVLGKTGCLFRSNETERTWLNVMCSDFVHPPAQPKPSTSRATTHRPFFLSIASAVLVLVYVFL